MRAVTFDVSVGRYLVARSLGRVTNLALFGRLTGLRVDDVPDPVLPGPEWVRLRVISCGICGTDIGNLSYRASPAMEPFGSFPAVPGHEVLAEVERVGDGVTGIEVGQRVVVDPVLSCRVRGYPAHQACVSCREGSPATCEHAGEDGPASFGGHPLARGLMIGYHRQLPGGFGERMVAHQSQLFAVPEALDDRTAVLIEPLSVGLRAVLGGGPRPDSTLPVFVIGSGAVAFATVWALRATGFQGTIVAQAKRDHEAAMHRALGATETVSSPPEARQALIETGAMAYQPIVGPEVYSAGGFPYVFDCVGTRESLDQAMRYAAPRAVVILLGCAGQVRGLDLSLLWARELTVRGFVGYGRESWRGRQAHTFEVTRDLLVEGRPPVGRMVTHVFPLGQFGTALSAAANHGRSEAIKVLLQPAGALRALQAPEPRLLAPGA